MNPAPLTVQKAAPCYAKADLECPRRRLQAYMPALECRKMVEKYVRIANLLRTLAFAVTKQMLLHVLEQSTSSPLLKNISLLYQHVGYRLLSRKRGKFWKRFPDNVS